MISQLDTLKLVNGKQLIAGNHAGIIQSILDFDYLNGRSSPSIVAIIGVKQSKLRYFWGDKEILISGYLNLDELDDEIKAQITLFAVAQSGRKVLSVCKELLVELNNCLGGMIFAESVTERHAIELREIASKASKFIIGPASVGLLIGGKIKLGAIGGTTPSQIINSRITESGSVAVVSSSGGMINEIINSVSRIGGKVSFAIAIGGERFPITKPVEIIRLAMNDKHTKHIVYFGELGGTDEYEIADYYKNLKEKKPIIAYIAGTFAEKIENAPQFGHAKALANSKSETASEKKKILKKAGVIIADTFGEFEDKIKDNIDIYTVNNKSKELEFNLENRKKSLFIDNVSSDNGGEVKILGKSLTEFIIEKSLSDISLSMFLGRNPKSKELAKCFDMSLRLLIDHGPQVSGVVNTMITARAGKDLTSSLASGILTIGSRFGGAINEAAELWFGAVKTKTAPYEFVDSMNKQGKNIPGIGHKKYRADYPDPRIAVLEKELSIQGRHTQFARNVASITTSKKANLILNVDGYIAAVMLDIFSDYEKLSEREIGLVISSDFFNAIFVYARTVGLIAHHIEQKRIDDGLFRLPHELISPYKITF